MDNIISDFKQRSERAIDALKEDLKTIRTGRATPALVEGLIVEAYGGTQMKLREVATLATDGPQALIVAPFDPSILQDIERSIQKSSMGFSAATQGTRIRLTIPPLSQEQREKLLKVVSQKIEEKRESVRIGRDEGRRRVRTMLEKKELSEDHKFRIERELDTAAQAFSQRILEIKEAKETEIKTV